MDPMVYSHWPRRSEWEGIGWTDSTMGTVKNTDNAVTLDERNLIWPLNRFNFSFSLKTQTIYTKIATIIHWGIPNLLILHQLEAPLNTFALLVSLCWGFVFPTLCRHSKKPSAYAINSSEEKFHLKLQMCVKISFFSSNILPQ